MANESKNSLKEKILDEMVVDYADTIDKNFECAKKFIRITKEGKIDVLVKDRVKGPTKILLYLLGKVYAKKAGLVDEDVVGNAELMEELNIQKGSLLPWIKTLSDAQKIKKIRKGASVKHVIALNVIEGTIKDAEHQSKGGVNHE